MRIIDALARDDCKVVLDENFDFQCGLSLSLELGEMNKEHLFLCALNEVHRHHDEHCEKKQFWSLMSTLTIESTSGNIEKGVERIMCDCYPGDDFYVDVSYERKVELHTL